MKQEAAAALEKFHADRKAAAAAKLAENLCALPLPVPPLARLVQQRLACAGEPGTSRLALLRATQSTVLD